MICPKCKSDSVAVRETRPTAAGTRRRRHCKACGHKFSTVEQVVPDRSNYTDELAMVPRRELEQTIERLQSLITDDDARTAQPVDTTDDKEVA